MALIVVANAAVQAILVAAAPLLPLDAVAIALAAASGLSLMLAAGGLWMLARRGNSLRGSVWVAASALAAAGAMVVAPVAVAAVIALTCPIIAAAGPVGAWGAVRRRPWSTVGLLVVTIVGVALAAVVAMLCGLFVTGAIGSGASWLVIGAGAAAITGLWARWQRRDGSVRGGVAAMSQP